MADTLYGVLNQAVSNNVTNSVETIGSRQEFITFTTSLDLRSLADVGGTSFSQANLNKFIQIVSLRGQPVIMGDVTFSAGSTLYMMNEHYQAWGSVNSVSNVKLVDRVALDGVNFGFGDFAGTGSVTGYILTVTAVTSGSITLGTSMTGVGITGTASSAFVTGMVGTALAGPTVATGTGGVGTYLLATTSSSTGSISMSGQAINAVSITTVLT
jgi:hypothetical protein